MPQPIRRPQVRQSTRDPRVFDSFAARRKNSRSDFRPQLSISTCSREKPMSRRPPHHDTGRRLVWPMVRITACLCLSWSASDQQTLAQGNREDDARPLYAVRIDGTGLRKIVDLPDWQACGSPALSADGTLLAVDAWKSQDGKALAGAHVLVMKPDGTDVRDLGPGAMPNWSPRGGRITFSQYSPDQGVWVMRADGTERQLLDPTGWSSQWSPNGRMIAFTRREQNRADIGVYDLVEDSFHTVFGDGGSPYQQIFWNQAWSPDSQWLVFKAQRHDGAWDVGTVHVLGQKHGFRVLHGEEVFADFAWHPDGERIFFGEWNPRLKRAEIRILPRDGSTPPAAVAVEGYSRDIGGLCLTPDGTELIFSGRRMPVPAIDSGN